MPYKIDDQTRQGDFFNVCETCPITCCSDVHPPVTAKRMAIVQNYLNTNKIAIDEPFEKNGYSFLRGTNDKCCVFFDKVNKKCRIHTVKPETCVAGPLTFDINPEAGRIEWFLKIEKICPLAGVLYRNRKALKSHLECARRELLRLVRDLEAEALCAILKVEEPDTFKIGEEDLGPEVLAKLNPSIKHN